MGKHHCFLSFSRCQASPPTDVTKRLLVSKPLGQSIHVQVSSSSEESRHIEIYYCVFSGLKWLSPLEHERGESRRKTGRHFFSHTYCQSVAIIHRLDPVVFLRVSPAWEKFAKAVSPTHLLRQRQLKLGVYWITRIYEEIYERERWTNFGTTRINLRRIASPPWLDFMMGTSTRLLISMMTA